MPKSLTAKRALVEKREQVVQVEDMTGGYNLRVAQTLIEPAQARTLRNFSLEEPGALIVRPGHARFSTTSWGSSRAQGGQRVYLSSHTFTLDRKSTRLNSSHSQISYAVF